MKRLVPLKLAIAVLVALQASACHDAGIPPAEPSTTPSTSADPQAPTETTASAPTDPAAESDPVETASASHPDLVLLSPGAGDRVAGNPIRVVGRARTFENNVVIQLRDSKGDLITTAWTTANGDMGTLNPFETEVWITRDPGPSLTVELIEHSARDGSVRALTRRTLPFTARTITETLMFPLQNPGNDCTHTVPVRRAIPAATGRLRAILEALVAGPTEAEKSELNVMNPFPRGAAVRGVNLVGAKAVADFNEALTNVGGSCRAMAIRASIENTLNDVEGVDSVEIRADGSADTALQP